MNQEIAFDIDVHDVKTKLEQNEPFLLLDCRTPEEYGFAHLDGATLIPMAELANRLDDLEPHRESSVIVYCHLGGRSAMVTEWLRNQGWNLAQNMSGGIDAWSRLIDPTVPRYS